MKLDLPESDNLFVIDLITRFKQVNQIKYVNQGGCAIVAHASHQFVMKHAPHLEPQIVYLVQEYYQSKINNISNGIPESCAHAVLCLQDKYYFDSDGLIASNLDELYTHMSKYGVSCRSIVLNPVDPDFCLASIRTPTVVWNDTFNRRVGLRTIKPVFESKQNYFYKHCA